MAKPKRLGLSVPRERLPLTLRASFYMEMGGWKFGSSYPRFRSQEAAVHFCGLSAGIILEFLECV